MNLNRHSPEHARRRGAAITLSALIWVFAWAVPAAATPPPVSDWVKTETTTFPVPEAICRTQGIATDGRSLWFSWMNGLSRTDVTGARVLTDRCTGAIPQPLRDTGHNHIGDIDVYKGILYAPIEDGPSYLSPWIALYDARDLSFTGKAFELERDYLTEGVPWVAIDGPRKVAYTAEWNHTTRLNVHRLSDFKVIRTVPLDKEVPRIQGAKVFRGQLYLSRDNGAEKSIEAIDPETGHVTHLFDRDLGNDNETEGIAFVRRPTGTVMQTLDIQTGPDAGIRMRGYRINGDTTAPVLSAPTVQPRRFRTESGRREFRIAVGASEPVTVTGRWYRCAGAKRRPCSRLRAIGPAFVRDLAAGPGRFSVKAKLTPGTWRLRLTPVDEADITGTRAEAEVTVLPPRRHR